MHAFLFISSLGAGGAERALSELASWLAATGWRVTLATLTQSDQSDRYGLHESVHRVHLGNPPAARTLVGRVLNNWTRVRALRKALRQAAPDVIVSFMEATNVLAIVAARPLSIPVVAVERTDPSQHLSQVPAMWRLGRRRYYRRAGAVVAQTQGAASWLAQECACSVTVIPNALRPLPVPQASRMPWIVSAGRLEPVKGYDIVLKAFANVVDTHPGWRLVIAGEGRMDASLRQLAEDLGIADSVEWLGHVEEIEHLLEKASVVALASRYEGFPNVLLESLGMGAAVVATDCRSGPSEMITNAENGFLVPVDDVQAMALALRRLIEDADLRGRLGARAQAVRTVFAQPEVMRRWVAQLNGVVTARGGAFRG